jgi:DNA-binding beta-propeller fold protein YncE
MWATLSNGTVARVQEEDDPIFTFNVGTNPRGIAFDGANMWVANSGQLSVTKLRASDGAFLGSFAECNNCGNPLQIAFDGAQMWVTTSTGHLKRYRVSDGREVGNHFIPSGNLRGIAFDGANIWVAHSSGVTKL